VQSFARGQWPALECLTMTSPEESLIQVGRQLMKQRGLTHTELSALMLAILAVVSQLVTTEGNLILSTALAELEKEGKTKQ
jgi:hypothetical protein